MFANRMTPVAAARHAHTQGAADTSVARESAGRKAMSRLVLFGLVTLCALFAAGCRTNYIPNTDVEDNEYNQRVIDFCEQYRKAVERQNVPLLLKLADPGYYEDGGNVDATDDIDLAGLEEYLMNQFRETRAIRYEIRYRNVGKGRKNVVYVDYTYSASYRMPTHQGEVWRRKVADNRLELVPHGESFRVISGM